MGRIIIIFGRLAKNYNYRKNNLRPKIEKITSVLFVINSVVMNVLGFSVTNFLFNKLTDNSKKERKYDLVLEKLQLA